jgi:hypothetical protein
VSREAVMGYSKDIIQTNDGYVIKNYSVVLICIMYVMIVPCLLLLPLYIMQLIDYIKKHEIGNTIVMIVPIMIFCSLIFSGFISTKKIIIDEKIKKFIFKYRLFPFIKTKEINIDEIKYISINCLQDAVPGSDQFRESIYEIVSSIIEGLISGTNQYTEETYREKTDKTYKKKAYMVDLISEEQCSYTIFRSETYNEELIEFANKIGKIINKEVDDKNTVDGYKNIYKKNII